MLIRIGHSPDPDDAFMFYALTAGKVKIPGIEVEHVLEDIESLNRRARTGELEVTAVSAATYTLVHEQYRMMDPGASMGKGYGPDPGRPRAHRPRDELEEKVVAIPGSHTTAALLLRLYVGDPPTIEVAFDKIPKAVLEGQADLGLLIHEGQITHQQHGPRQGARPGRGVAARVRPAAAARHQRDAPRPGRGDAPRSSPRRSATRSTTPTPTSTRRSSTRCATAAGIDKETCRRFVLMYVNDYTKRLGDDGRAALERLYEMAHAQRPDPSPSRRSTRSEATAPSVSTS